MNNEIQAITKLLFKQKRQDVTLLYDLFFDYVSRNSMTENPYKVPESFLLVSAFASVFADLEVVTGCTGFVAELNDAERKATYEFVSHCWLVWQNENFIIDLVPIDGEFGLSVPNAVIQNPKRQRFFPKKKLYPNHWDIKKKSEFDHQVSDLVEILEMLMKKVPL